MAGAYADPWPKEAAIMIVCGIDPGLGGAIAVYDGGTGKILHLQDMPIYKLNNGKTTKRKLDERALIDIALTVGVLYSPAFAVVEQVSARPDQGTVSMFTFGYVLGAIYTAFAAANLPVEWVTPGAWKKTLKVPTDARAIVHRADEILPGSRELWRGVKGGALHDRAEAALLAYYGATYLRQSS